MKSKLFGFLFFLSVAGLFGQECDSLKLEKYIDAFAQVHGFNGTILVAKDNHIVISKSLGYADQENKVLNKLDTKFRIGSCSKQFTAIGILQLQAQGKISVYDKLSKYFPKIDRSDSITIDMLLTHCSGIYNFCGDDSYLQINTPALTRQKVMEIIEKHPLDFSPGTKFKYSNGGFFLLGEIIEKVSKQSFDQFIQTHILEKIKMNASGVDKNDTLIANKAKGYVLENGKLIPAPFDNMDVNIGSGSLYSTAPDVYKYFLALQDTVLLAQKEKEQFITTKNGSHGYGIMVDTIADHIMFTHGGWVYGFTSDIRMCFSDKTFIVVFSNNENDVWALSKGLQTVLFHAPIIYPYKYKEIQLDPSSLTKYVGKYGSLKVYVKDKSLYLSDISGEEEVKLLPESITRFFYEGENDRQIEFAIDEKQEVNRVWLIRAGIKKEINYTH